ncbi:MAG: hypothetical protein K6C05_02445 [Anaerovibrio sp.]|uniref:hypothetical protein n=1 Tax=Anaerovibrio sp. TaxID=1872532 RepID=UPI0025FD05A8|nr:hypothetical protein [Anaerovibrio sp.]MCR5175689.1 hypothetical protein [Anaerovibrio sp.]
MYLCKFDEEGKRIATVVSGIHFTTEKDKQSYLKDGYIETSDEDYQYYIGNKGTGKNGTGYVRGSDGKPVDAPAYEPTTDEKKQAIISQYESDKEVLKSQYADAMMADNTELADELKAELVELNNQFDKDIKAVEG